MGHSQWWLKTNIAFGSFNFPHRMSSCKFHPSEEKKETKQRLVLLSGRDHMTVVLLSCAYPHSPAGKRKHVNSWSVSVLLSKVTHKRLRSQREMTSARRAAGRDEPVGCLVQIKGGIPCSSTEGRLRARDFYRVGFFWGRGRRLLAWRDTNSNKSNSFWEEPEADI